MKILLDTNAWLASFLTHGTCQELVNHCIENHTLFISSFIVDEITSKLSKKFKFPKDKIKKVVLFLNKHVESVKEKLLEQPVCRDPDDDFVLSAAISGNVDCLITGDQDLLILKIFKNIPIIKPNEFWEFEKRQTEN